MKHMNTPPTSFRLRLQLHAHVTNPYTENLVKNRKVTASMSASLPATETYLFSGDVGKTGTIVIPAGVHVVKAYGHCWAEAEDGEAQATVEMYTSKNYISISCMASPFETANDTQTVYVGVTPGKSYYVTAVIATDVANVGSAGGSFNISYSASINQQTPTVTDY